MTSHTTFSFMHSNTHKPIMVGATLLACMLGLSGCQSTPTAPVIQRENSIFETTGLGETKVQAMQSAINSANKTCGSASPIVLTDKVVYNGIIDARTGRMIEQVGTVVGAVLGTKSPDLTQEDDYEYTITFRCE